jgi:hypothetical protein
MSERKEVTGERRQLHVVELRNIYPLPDVIRAINSRMRQHVWCRRVIICLGGEAWRKQTA